MVYIYKKSIGNKTYYYLRASVRQGKRVVAKDVLFLGNSLDSVRKTLDKLPKEQIRQAYRNIHRFLESNTFVEMAQRLKLKQSPFIEKSLFEQVEACRLHWQNVFQKYDEKTKMDYLKKFVVDFAFNTTSIEGNTITLKEAVLLLQEQITPKNKQVHEVYDVQNTEKVFFDIMNKKVELSHETIQNIHKSLMTNIDARVGYRIADVHVIHSRFASTPFPYVKTDVNLLLDWFKKNKAFMHPLVLAGVFHHKFEKIHPFFDGNGRTGRMLLNLILLSFKYPPVIVRKRNRPAYLDALRKADSVELTKTPEREYKDLIGFLAAEFAENYWNTFL